MMGCRQAVKQAGIPLSLARQATTQRGPRLGRQAACAVRLASIAKGDESAPQETIEPPEDFRRISRCIGLHASAAKGAVLRHLGLISRPCSRML
jgi:hypothetical protein